MKTRVNSPAGNPRVLVDSRIEGLLAEVPDAQDVRNVTNTGKMPS